MIQWICAMEAVQSGRMGINQAARAHSILTITLKDRLAGRGKHGKNSGPEPYLTPQEEEEFVEFLKKCSKVVVYEKKEEVFSIVERVEGCSTLSLHTSDPLSRTRTNAIKKDNMFA